MGAQLSHDVQNDCNSFYALNLRGLSKSKPFRNVQRSAKRVFPRFRDLPVWGQFTQPKEKSFSRSLYFNHGALLWSPQSIGRPWLKVLQCLSDSVAIVWFDFLSHQFDFRFQIRSIYCSQFMAFDTCVITWLSNNPIIAFDIKVRGHRPFLRKSGNLTTWQPDWPRLCHSSPFPFLYPEDIELSGVGKFHSHSPEEGDQQKQREEFRTGQPEDWYASTPLTVWVTDKNFCPGNVFSLRARHTAISSISLFVLTPHAAPCHLYAAHAHDSRPDDKLTSGGLPYMTSARKWVVRYHKFMNDEYINYMQTEGKRSKDPKIV